MLADLRLEIELRSFDSVLLSPFIDFVLSDHGIDVAAKLVATLSGSRTGA